jgi:DNA-binding PadR family transcriptional regulator
VLEALDGEAMTGPAVFRRMRDRSIGDGLRDGVKAGDQAFLYPALHSLEADRKLRAAWRPDVAGVSRRTYQRRRLLPRLAVAILGS